MSDVDETGNSYFGSAPPEKPHDIFGLGFAFLSVASVCEVL